MDTNTILPLDGEIHPSSHKKYKEVVVLVHHFAGSKILMRRHTELLNSIGYDAVVFNLDHSKLDIKLPLSKTKKFGSRYIWEDNINSILDAIPGTKILYSFSFPSISTCKVITQRQTGEVKAWIADGGPFLTAESCFQNYFKYNSKIHFSPLRKVLLKLVLPFLGAKNYEDDAVKTIRSFPAKVPILSLKAERDRLVPEAAIDIFFNQAPQIKHKAVTFKGADHLLGLKTCPDKYKSVLETFLREYSTTIKTVV